MVLKLRYSQEISVLIKSYFFGVDRDIYIYAFDKCSYSNGHICQRANNICNIQIMLYLTNRLGYYDDLLKNPKHIL